MSTEPRTAHVNIHVTKPLEIEEPDWCAGHDDARAQFKVDISHDGPDIAIAPGGRAMFTASLTQAPFSTVDRAVGLYVEPTFEAHTCTPAEVEQLADDLEAAAAQLRQLGQQLAEILAGGTA